MVGQVRDVLAPLTQGRQPDGHDVEPEVEILAEAALLDRDSKILVGRGHNPHIRLDRVSTAHGRVFALLQHAQETRLRFHRHVTDLVQEQGSTLRLLETADAPLVGSREGALLVPEKIRFDEFAGNRGHVHGHERTATPLPIIVECAGDELLARAGFTRDHHGKVDLHQPCERAVDILHRGGAAHERHVLHLDMRAPPLSRPGLG